MGYLGTRPLNQRVSIMRGLSPWTVTSAKEQKTGPEMIRACEGLSLSSLKLYNVGCLGAFGRVDNVELHLLAFGQRLEAAVLNVAEMNEHVAACFTGYEAKAFGVIEPL